MAMPPAKRSSTVANRRSCWLANISRAVTQTLMKVSKLANAYPPSSTQLIRGERRIVGVMVESHLVEGRQDVVPVQPLTYGQSITDACLGWDDTAQLLKDLAQAVRERRKTPAAA